MHFLFYLCLGVGWGGVAGGGGGGGGWQGGGDFEITKWHNGLQ